MPENLPITQVICQWIEIFTHRSMREWSRYVRTIGLTMPQFGILLYLFHCKTCSVSEIGERMEISNPAASMLVDRLVTNGYLTRCKDPRDGRARQIELTGQGKQVIEASQSERLRWVQGLVERLSMEEKDAVMKSITTLIQAAQRFESELY